MQLVERAADPDDPIIGGATAVVGGVYSRALTAYRNSGTKDVWKTANIARMAKPPSEILKGRDEDDSRRLNA